MVFSARGLKRLVLPPSPPRSVKRCAVEPPADCELKELLSLYFSGVSVSFSCLPLDLGALSSFARRVLLALRGMEYGCTITYGELAAMVGSPKGQRAVGQVLKHNPLPLVLPCHRVVAKRGLGGFSAGLEWKRWLLELESGE